MIVRHQAGSKRAAIVIFACAVAWVMGVRTPRAASFETIQIAGNGRATLTIDEVGAAPIGTSEAEEDRFGHLEVFAKMTYGSEISVFGRGLYIRSTFTVPRTGDTAVLVVDVDRRGDAKRWDAEDRGLRARLYTIPKGGGVRFDGAPASGTLESCEADRRALLVRSFDSVSSETRPRLRPASSAPSTLTSNHVSIERDTNW